MDVEQLNKINGFVIDMDGVLYRGRSRLPGADRLLDTLQQADVPFVLLTNNSTLTVEQYVAKLADMDIQVEANRIITSAVATGVFLAERAEPGARVYMIGMDGVREALESRGFALSAESPGYVVVGLDRSFSYDKLRTATLAIRAGAEFVGTNPDRTFPSERGLEPGTGAILAAIQAATGTAPHVVGKPQPEVFRSALKLLGTEPHETAMIGDRLSTDIAGGARAGLQTILVLTGVTTRDDLSAADGLPNLVFENLEEMADRITL
jgi:4-nitrophenyl phosphatase